MMGDRQRPHRAIRSLGRGAVHVACAFVLAAAVLLSPRSDVRAERVYDSEIVKAGVVAQLLRFVEWPANVSGPRPPVVNVAFLGPSRIASALAARPDAGLRVRVVERAADIGEPHAVFVTREFDASLSSVVSSFANRPILVIGEGPSAAARGAAFGLRDDGVRVRLEVNRRVLERTRLRVSYHVLRLATEVGP